MPLRTALYVAPQHRGATDQQRPGGPPHLGWQPVAAFERRIAFLQDLLIVTRSHGRYPSASQHLPPLLRVSPTLRFRRGEQPKRRRSVGCSPSLASGG